MGKQEPDQLAKMLGHLIVGAGATYLAGKAFKHAGPAVLVAIFAMIAHAEMDAPMARALSDLGF